MLTIFRSTLACLFIALVFSGCTGNVQNTVLQDFGLQDRPDGYQSGEEITLKNMRTVGITEIKRLNTVNQRGELKYQKENELSGKFYKQVKRYTKSYPLTASSMSRSGNKKLSGFNGIIEYSYEFYEGPRFSNRTKAEASDATIPSGIRGRDAFRYTFNSAGIWSGGKGKVTSR